jgi:hypothetical protein
MLIQLQLFAATDTANNEMAAPAQRAIGIIWCNRICETSAATPSNGDGSGSTFKPNHTCIEYTRYKQFCQMGRCVEGKVPVDRLWVKISGKSVPVPCEESTVGNKTCRRRISFTIENCLGEVFGNLLRKKCYRFHLLQATQPSDKVKKYTFCCYISSKISSDETLSGKLVFSEKTSFHLSGTLKKHNIILGTQKSNIAQSRYQRR